MRRGSSHDSTSEKSGMLRLYDFCDVFGWCSLCFLPFSPFFLLEYSFGFHFGLLSFSSYFYGVFHDGLVGMDICCFVLCRLFLLCDVVGAREKLKRLHVFLLDKTAGNYTAS